MLLALRSCLITAQPEVAVGLGGDRPSTLYYFCTTAPIEITHCAFKPKNIVCEQNYS